MNPDETRDEREQMLIDMSRQEVLKSGAKPEILDALIGAIDEARQGGDRAHPLWPYRHVLVALYRSRPEAGRSAFMIDRLKAMGLEPPDTARAMGRWMNRLCLIVDREVAEAEKNQNQTVKE